MLSDWVTSYRSFGFDYEFCICLDNDTIVGGYGAVIAKALAFKFFIVPYGPIMAQDHLDKMEATVASVVERAKFHKSCYCHVTFPVSKAGNNHAYIRLPELAALKNAKSDHLFKYVYSSNGLNWVDTKGFEDEEALLNSFRTTVRRDIRSAMRKGLDVRILQTEAEIKSGYALCLQNAERHGYSLRDWNSFKHTLLKMTASGNAKFLAAYKENDLKGAVLIVKGGNYYTYILGGSKREKPDVLAGHLLQWEAIRTSFHEKRDGYNISLGGSKGVTDFKDSFSTAQILFDDSKYHWILRPMVFKAYIIIEKSVKPYKGKIAKLFSKLKK